MYVVCIPEMNRLMRKTSQITQTHHYTSVLKSRKVVYTYIRTSSGWYPEVVHRLMVEKQTTLTKCHNLNSMSIKVILYLRAEELSDGGAEDLPAISKP